MSIDSARARESIQWLLDMAVSKIPATYEGEKDWEKTKKLWAGVKVRREGLKIKTNRRWREVRHGRGIRYTLKFPQPVPHQPSPIKAVVREVRRLAPDQLVPNQQAPIQPGSENAASSAQWAIDAQLETPVEFDARIERWNLGVQLFSVNVTGKMRVRLDMTSTLAFWSDFSEIPPALVIDPKVTDAHLRVEDVRVDRVSKIGGEVAEQWGEIVEDLARDVFLKDKNEKWTSKLNKAIDKNRDDLRFSFSKWFELKDEPQAPQEQATVN